MIGFSDLFIEFAILPTLNGLNNKAQFFEFVFIGSKLEQMTGVEAFIDSIIGSQTFINRWKYKIF